MFDLPGSREDERPDFRTRGSVHSLDELGHLGNSIFDWDRRVGTVEVVEVDVIDSQPRQGLVEGHVDVFRVGLHDPTGFSMGEAELGGKEYFVTLSSLLEPTQPERRQGWGRTMSGAEVLGGHGRTISQSALRCRRRRRQYPRRYSRTRKRHLAPVITVMGQPVVAETGTVKITFKRSSSVPTEP